MGGPVTDSAAMSGDVADARRFVAARAIGTFRLLYWAHADLEDAEAAAEAGQVEMAVWAARLAVSISLSIRGLQRGGEVEWVLKYGLAFDHTTGLDPEEVAAAHALVNAGLVVDPDDPRAVQAWLADLRSHLEATERLLGYDHPLASVRRPDGLFPALRLARRWIPVCEGLDLPPLLPSSWTTGEGQDGSPTPT